MIFILAIIIYNCFWLFQLTICFLLSIRRERRDQTNQLLNDKQKTDSSGGVHIVFSIKQFVKGLEKWTLLRVSRIPSYHFRMFCYKHIFRAKMGKSSIICGGSILRCPSRLVVGENSIIGDQCEIDARGNVTIGKNCNLSSEVHIWTGQHDSKGIYFEYISKPVVINDRCWVSSNTIILPGVTMGEGAVLAAGAVLTTDAEPFGIYAGIPAKKIGERPHELKYVFDSNHWWFI